MLRLSCDGSCVPNPGEMKVGVYGPGVRISKEKGIGTSNQAEYLALIEALRYCEENGILNVQINMDSRLVVNQMTGRWAVRDEVLGWLSETARSYISRLNNVKIKRIPREKNVKADMLSRA